MSTRTVYSALFIEGTGDVKCGNCGKKLFFLEKFSKKVQKSIDKSKKSAIIIIKCNRCSVENSLNLD